MVSDTDLERAWERVRVLPKEYLSSTPCPLVCERWQGTPDELAQMLGCDRRTALHVGLMYIPRADEDDDPIIVWTWEVSGFFDLDRGRVRALAEQLVRG